MSSVPKLVIEGIQTTPPTSVTNPKTSFKVSVAKSASRDVLSKFSHIILYYKKHGGEESGWFHSGWIKATLGKVLSEQPLLAGRLRRVDGGDDGAFEIVSNDSGVRVMEANIPNISVEEFVGMQKNDREAASRLVHFKGVDENVHFSPLLYIQVTNFKCGGYSVGISYNLLLADPFLMESFVRRWAEIHKTTIFESDVPKIPLFYLPNIKRLGIPPPALIVLKPPTKHISTNFVYLDVPIARDPSRDTCNSIALSCIREAEGRNGVKMTSNFTLLVKEASGDVRVDDVSLSGLIGKAGGPKCVPKCLANDDFGTNAIEFWKGNGPTLVSRYVGCVREEGLVYLVIYGKDEGKLGMKALVAFPNNERPKDY